MVIHCVRTKQIRKGHYMLMADGIIEVQGYCYPVEAGTIVAPSEETVMITESSGNQYIWVFLPQKSEWALETEKTSLVLKKFDGKYANVLFIKKDDIGKCEKKNIVVRYTNLLYDLPMQIKLYLKVA